MIDVFADEQKVISSDWIRVEQREMESWCCFPGLCHLEPPSVSVTLHILIWATIRFGPAAYYCTRSYIRQLAGAAAPSLLSFLSICTLDLSISVVSLSSFRSSFFLHLFSFCTRVPFFSSAPPSSRPCRRCRDNPMRLSTSSSWCCSSRSTMPSCRTWLPCNKWRYAWKFSIHKKQFHGKPQEADEENHECSCAGWVQGRTKEPRFALLIILFLSVRQLWPPAVSPVPPAAAVALLRAPAPPL